MAQWTIEQAFQIAMDHHRSGKLAEAEAIYRQILIEEPAHFRAVHHLGLIAQRIGRLDTAVDLIRIAIAIKPDYADAYTNLGTVLRAQGKLDEAIAAYSRAIELNPAASDAYSNLGNALRDQKKLREAIAACSRALELKPDFPEALGNLGNALGDSGRLNEALAAYSKAVQLQPHSSIAYRNLGGVLLRVGQPEQAVAAFNIVIDLDPSSFDAHVCLASAFHQQGKFHAAIAECRRAISLNAQSGDAHNVLGMALRDAGLVDDALAACARATQLKPDNAEAHNNLANALKDQGRIGESLACYSHGIVLKPDDAALCSNRLLTLHFDPRYDAASIFHEHLAWNKRYASRLAAQESETSRKLIPSHTILPAMSRRLRIAYISPDFRWHPVGRFLLPLLEFHNHEEFIIHCYSDVRVSDELTQRLRTRVDAWQHIVGLSDEQVAQLVQRDGIDILVDLAGHTAHNRLLAFARHPAPVQVTYLGYPDTTGLNAMNYRMTDAHADPPGMTEMFHTERLERLSESFLCFSPTDSHVAVSVAPAIKHGHATFGSFNDGAKVSASTVALWARILHKVPGATLLIKNWASSSQGAQRHLRDAFATHGIGSDRLDFRSRVASHLEHLRMFDQVDIALDPFPYHGTMTTCEALWMGVPVVTLAGRTHVSRVGVSILSNVELATCIAHSHDQYVQIAADLAADLPRLADLRAGLRQRVLQSPLTDARRFASEVEAAYCKMWRECL